MALLSKRSRSSVDGVPPGVREVMCSIPVMSNNSYHNKRFHSFSLSPIHCAVWKFLTMSDCVLVCSDERKLDRVLVETERNRQMANQIAHRTFTASHTSDRSILPTGPQVNKLIISSIAVEKVVVVVARLSAPHRNTSLAHHAPQGNFTAYSHSPRA